MFKIINIILTTICIISGVFFFLILAANWLPSLNLQWAVAWIPMKTRWILVLPYVLYAFLVWGRK